MAPRSGKTARIKKTRGVGSPTDTSLTASLPPVFVAEFTGRDRDGELLAKPVEWASGEPPIVRVLIGKRERNQPGVGDQALLKIDRIANARDFGGIFARVLKVLSVKPQQVIGVYRSYGNSGGGRLVPVDKKALGREIAIRAENINGALEGELVAVETLRDSSLGLKLGRVVERLGDVSSEKAASMIAIHALGIPNIFGNLLAPLSFMQSGQFTIYSLAWI